MIDKERLGLLKADLAMRIATNFSGLADWTRRDDAGRAVPTVMQPHIIAQHAFDVADALVQKMNRDGWLDSLPDDNTQGG